MHYTNLCKQIQFYSFCICIFDNVATATIIRFLSLVARL